MSQELYFIVFQQHNSYFPRFSTNKDEHIKAILDSTQARMNVLTSGQVDSHAQMAAIEQAAREAEKNRERGYTLRERIDKILN